MYLPYFINLIADVLVPHRQYQTNNRDPETPGSKKTCFSPINGINIERVESFNFFGIILQETLSWDSHVTLVKNKNFKSNWNIV